MNHKISIIIPIYNVENYLPNCLDSIIYQSYQDLEIILVNDGSTDVCPKICDNYAAKDTRIKVIHKKNGGLSDARNAGFDLVTGDYLSFVDSDDVLSLNFYESLLNISVQYQADIVECNFFKFCNESEIHQFLSEDQLAVFDTEQALKLLIKEQLKQVVWNKLYKTNIVNSLLFEKGKIHEDEFWTYKVFANAKKIVKTGKCLYFYRQQNESIMAEKYTLKRLAGIEAREERLDFMSAKFPYLTSLAAKFFWHSIMYNYQKLTKIKDLDNDGFYRKKIHQKMKNKIIPAYFSDWTLKEKMWYKFFFFAPNLCSKFRNRLHVGV